MKIDHLNKIYYFSDPSQVELYFNQELSLITLNSELKKLTTRISELEDKEIESKKIISSLSFELNNLRTRISELENTK
jgi:predicted RNase H-like nuclease (RuvC/YqgF family)